MASAITNPPGIGREVIFGKRFEGGKEVDVVFEIAGQATSSELVAVVEEDVIDTSCAP